MSFDPIINREIGLRLRRLREGKSLSREQLAGAADISVQFLADIETGRKGMTVQTLRKLVMSLRCSADDLILGYSLASDLYRDSLPAALLHMTPDQAKIVEEVLNLVAKLLPPERAPDL